MPIWRKNEREREKSIDCDTTINVQKHHESSIQNLSVKLNLLNFGRKYVAQYYGAQKYAVSIFVFWVIVCVCVRMKTGES